MPDEIVHTTETVVTETTTLPPAPKVSEHWDAGQDAAQIEAAMAPLREELAKLRHDVEDDAEVLDALCHNQRLGVAVMEEKKTGGDQTKSQDQSQEKQASTTAAESEKATQTVAAKDSKSGNEAKTSDAVIAVAAEKKIEEVKKPDAGKKPQRGVLATLFFGRTRE